MWRMHNIFWDEVLDEEEKPSEKNFKECSQGTNSQLTEGYLDVLVSVTKLKKLGVHLFVAIIGYSAIYCIFIVFCLAFQCIIHSHFSVMFMQQRNMRIERLSEYERKIVEDVVEDLLQTNRESLYAGQLRQPIMIKAIEC